MLLLLGATGYVGQAFAEELTRRGTPFQAVSRAEVDYTRFEPLRELLKARRPKFVVNCAGYTGKPNVDACERARAETLQGNVLFPMSLAHACSVTGIPFGHVSSGCIYSGAKIADEFGRVRPEKDLMVPGVRHLVEQHPTRVHGFTEIDTPNFSFRDGPCSFYSGTKALAEEAIAGVGGGYLWRLRIPFDEVDGPRNYLSKVQRYAKVYDNVNSISHRRDFAKASLDLWERQAPFGTYNITNPGWVTTRQVVERIKTRLRLHREFEYFENDTDFYHSAAQTPRSNCVLDSSKLKAAGVLMRPVEDALDEALARWTPEQK
ncbi:MAG TPA: sugar nucleotide-binding protein [Verrucomicrobiota bacterium]|nr:dTDP-4-dehydrorhamnose reductase [Verrucomicrobiales bacterium]HRI14208.1 sugar nucleotide-binding protein [Verrucomicrobiota bacterium]